MDSKNWPQYRLAELCSSIDYGYTTSASEAPVGPRFLRITDIVGGFIDWNSVPYCAVDGRNQQKYRLHHGDIVIARTGASTGSSMYVSEPPEAVFASYLVRLKVGNLADTRFISYFLKSPQFWNYIHGVLGDKSAQPNASASTMTAVKVRLPPLREQRAIAHILGTLDDKIELNRQLNHTLEAIARAIFKSWFVDFDPVWANMEGRPYPLDPATLALFPDTFEDSTLRGIPAGWTVGPVSFFANLTRDSVNPSDSPSEWFDHYSIPAFDNGTSPSAELGETIKSNKYLIPADAVLLSKLNPRIPRVWLPNLDSDKPSICSTEFLVVTSRNGASREYIYSLFNSQDFLAHFAGLVTGTSGSHQRVSPKSFLEMKIVVSPQTIMDAFTRIAQPLHAKIHANIAESRTLGALRDTLLPTLISGELRVPAAAELIEEVAS